MSTIAIAPNVAIEETTVLYPGCVTEAEVVLQAILSDETGVYAVCDKSPFHPLDPFWPDQPGEIGALVVDTKLFPVIDTLTCAFAPNTGSWLLGSRIDFKRSTPGWTFLVAHKLNAPDGEEFREVLGQPARLTVDHEFRTRIATAHTANHLTALALNYSVTAFASDRMQRDSLGNPDLDASAIVESKIDVNGSTDRYRLGKSLRKAGFNSSAFLDGLDEVQSKVNSKIAEWLATKSSVSIIPAVSKLSERREWCCDLSSKAARIPCGGVHVGNLGQIQGSKVSMETNDTRDALVVRTDVQS